jgi:hypothetical protein
MLIRSTHIMITSFLILVMWGIVTLPQGVQAGDKPSSPHPSPTHPSEASAPPAGVIAAIQRYCTNCKLVTVDLFSKPEREGFLEMLFRQDDHPGWVNGDFNGDGQTDYALLLYKKLGKKNILAEDLYAEQFIVLLASKERDKYQVQVLEVFNNGAIHQGLGFFYLGLVPAGTVVEQPKTTELEPGVPEKLKLSSTGIAFVKAGSYVRVYYVELGEFKSIPVVD